MLYWPEPFEGFARRREAGTVTGDIYVAAVYAKAITCGQDEDEPAEDDTCPPRARGRRPGMHTPGRAPASAGSSNG